MMAVVDLIQDRYSAVYMFLRGKYDSNDYILLGVDCLLVPLASEPPTLVQEALKLCQHFSVTCHPLLALDDYLLSSIRIDPLG
jgi:hypothetical protein